MPPKTEAAGRAVNRDSAVTKLESVGQQLADQLLELAAKLSREAGLP